jgi:recombination protein RecR
MKLPESLRVLRDKLADLPSIGPRQATRLVFYLLNEGPEAVSALGGAVQALAKIKTCERCYFIHENAGALCDTCGNQQRNQGVILVIEKETDLISLEDTGKYRGRYFILGEVPRTGLLEDWQKKRVDNFKADIQKNLGGQAEEIILGFNPTAVGDFHATILAKEFAGLSKKISRLGRGLPTGGEIEFADDETLGASLDRRS